MGAGFARIKGRHTTHEKAENQKIMTELFSPFLPSARTKVYAAPAPHPPTAPSTAGSAV